MWGGICFWEICNATWWCLSSKKSAKSLVPYSNQVGFLPNKCQRARRPCANPRLCWSALQNVIGKGRYLVAKRGFDFGGGQGILLDWSLAVDTLLFARVGKSVMMVDILMVCLALGCGCSKTKVVATQAEPSAQMRAPTNNIFWMHWPESLAQISTNWNIGCEWIQTQLVQTHHFFGTNSKTIFTSLHHLVGRENEVCNLHSKGKWNQLWVKTCRVCHSKPRSGCAYACTPEIFNFARKIALSGRHWTNTTENQTAIFSHISGANRSFHPTIFINESGLFSTCLIFETKKSQPVCKT